ncbi:MAG TPA: protein translocase subunit SecF [Burkholderiales bacterium]|nr:protein translocase subunit SecF [Burkholderiales bacterium]
MSNRNEFWLLIMLLTAIMTATFPRLIAQTRIGLEFKGGQEIVFQAEPPAPGAAVDHDMLVAAASILEKRANKLGVAEPAVNILGKDMIRVEITGVAPGDSLFVDLKNPNGLPLKLTEKYSETVGGVLGAGDLHDTLRAALIALGAVFIFLVFAYRGKGLIAVFATMVSLWLVLAAFVALHAVLSLAAIVAFVLAIGISSGANIIAFERAREEAAAGATAGRALKAGATKSFRTIADANATVLICAVILLVAGLGPIRGFALTTILGILASFVANVLLARVLVRWFFGDDQHTGLFGARSTAGARGGIDFVRWSKYGIAVSLIALAAGGLSLVKRPLNLDIEFKPGTALDVTIDRPIGQDEATDLIASAGMSPATVAIGGKNQNTIAARFDNVLDSSQVDAIIAKVKEAYGPGITYAENTADPAVAKELARKSVTVVLLAILGTALFIWYRFDSRMAAASAVAVINSVLFVISVFALLHLEIDITFIAAMLIVVGYALNEAVVVFDRIRENASAHYTEIVNRSIRQVMRRSLFTVLTVLAGAASLYFFGAEPLQMFSLAIFLGLVWGAFSSIFVAPRLWLAMRPKYAVIAA